MNNQEAKLILGAYRPGGQDTADPMFAEALEQVRRDPELQKWFADQCAYDARIQYKLKEAIAIPPDLKASLLAQRKIARPRMFWQRGWWRQPAWLTAAAAALVLLASLAMLWLKPSGQPQFAAFRQAMVRNSLLETNHVSFMAGDMTTVRNWLKTQNASTDFNLPASLHNSMLHGCKVIDWRGHEVTMLCFMSSGGGHVDLFVVNCTHFQDFTPTPTAQFARSDGLTTAVWCDGRKTYLLAANLNEQQTKKIL